MAEATETQPVETDRTRIVDTGAAFLTVHHNGDIMGHSAVIKWRGDEVAITRSSSGRSEETTITERDTVTEGALLALAVPGVRPVNDFSLFLIGDDCSGTWDSFVHLRVRGGRAEVKRGTTGDHEPAPVPMWFLHALHDFALGEFADDDEGE